MIDALHIKKFAYLLILPLLLAACDIKTEQRNKHESYDPTREQIEAEKRVTIEPQNLEQLEVSNVVEIQSSLQSPTEHLNEIVIKYAQVVLNKEHVESVENKPSDKLIRLLDVFNDSLLVVLEANLNNPELNEILTQYIDLVFSWCDEKLDGCHNTKYFYRSAISSKVIQRLAVKQEQAKDYYTYLQMAFLLKNHSLDSELRTLYLARASELYSLKGQIDSGLYDRHIAAVSLILNESLENPEDPRNKTIFDNQEVYRLSASSHQNINRSLLLNAFKYYIYNCTENQDCQTLSDNFQASITNRLQSTNGNLQSNYLFDHSLKQIVDNFRNRDGQILSQNLSLDLQLDSDEYLYILDGLLREDFSAEFASQLYRHTKQDSAKMLEHIKKYTKILIAQMILLTKEYMIRVYEETKDFEPKRTVIYVIEQSTDLSNQWSDLISKIEIVRSFATQNLKGHGQFQSVEQVLLTISKNIKYMAVYPHMMMLAYQLEDQDIGDIDISIRGYKITIPTKLVINAFFDKGFPPWFDFVDDRIPLKKHKLIFAFYYAIKTATFKTKVDDGSEVKNNEFDFLRTVMGKYLQKDVKSLTTEIDNNEYYLRNSKYNQVKRFCKQLESYSQKKILSKEWFEEINTLPDEKATLSFSDLSQSTFLGPMSLHTKDGLLSYALDHLKGTGELLHKIRNEIMPNMSFVRSLFEVLKSTYGISDIKQINCSSPENQTHAEICSLDQFLKEREELVRRNWAYAIDWHDNFGDCIKGIHSIERARQRQMIAMEQAYLTKIHGWLALIRDFGANKTLSEIKPQLSGKSTHIVNSIEEFTSTEQNTPILQLFNSRLKISDSDLPTIHKSNGTRPFSGLDEIIVSERGSANQLVFKYGNVDILFRLRDYMVNPDYGVAPGMIVTPVSDLRTIGNAYKDEVSSRVQYSANLETFLEQAMASLNGSGDTKINWFTRSDPSNYIKEHNKMMVELLLLQGKTAVHCSLRSPQGHPGMDGPAAYDTSQQTADPEQAPEEDVQLGYLSWRACPTVEKTIDFSANDIISHVKQSVRMLNMTDEDAEYLKLMGKDELYNEIFIRGLFLDRDDWTQPWAFLKPFYRILTENSTNPNWTKDSLHQPYTFYKDQKNLGFFIFEISPITTQLVRCQYKSYVDTYQNALDQLSTAAKEASERDQNNPDLSLRYTLDRVTTSKDRTGEFSYLSLSDREAHEDRMREFHGRETQGYYQDGEECHQGGL